MFCRIGDRGIVVGVWWGGGGEGGVIFLGGNIGHFINSKKLSEQKFDKYLFSQTLGYW